VIEGLLGRVLVGDMHPVRMMAVINLSRESFYRGSVATPNEALDLARTVKSKGADLIDIGAVSTAPGSPAISESLEQERLFPSLKEILDNVDIGISVDTQRASIASKALAFGAECINDVSGLLDPGMAKAVAEYDASAIIMASRHRPGDLLALDDIIPVLGERSQNAVDEGVSQHKICVDPGIGKWIPEKTPAHDLAILDGFSRLRVLDRPMMAAVSRKSFIGAKLNQPDPAQRLCGSIAAAAIAVYNGAHIVRTHDVSASIDAVRMAQAIRGRPPQVDGEIKVEALEWTGFGRDLAMPLRRIEVDERGAEILLKKGSFRILRVIGLTSMEAIIIKQEMLARGGDAAIPKLALRCDPKPEEIIVLGTLAQVSGLVNNLKAQPFRLPEIGKAIDTALKLLDDPGRYR
jgi:dihydropteroate synthase